MQYSNEVNSYPTLDNVLDNNNNNVNNMLNNNNNNSNHFKNQMMINNFNQINIVPTQSHISNINLNSFNSGMEANSGNPIPNKRSSAIYFKNQNEGFENILNSSKQNPKTNKDSDPFEGYY